MCRRYKNGTMTFETAPTSERELSSVENTDVVLHYIHLHNESKYRTKPLQ